jgi:hypothetical protein
MPRKLVVDCPRKFLVQSSVEERGELSVIQYVLQSISEKLREEGSAVGEHWRWYVVTTERRDELKNISCYRQ